MGRHHKSVVISRVHRSSPQSSFRQLRALRSNVVPRQLFEFQVFSRLDWRTNFRICSEENATSRYQSGQLPRSPFLDKFSLADDSGVTM